MFGSVRILGFPKGMDDSYAHKAGRSVNYVLDAHVCLHFLKGTESLRMGMSESYDLLLCIVLWTNYHGLLYQLKNLL
jgi:hypothetical protein